MPEFDPSWDIPHNLQALEHDLDVLAQRVESEETDTDDLRGILVELVQVCRGLFEVARAGLRN